MMTNTRQWLNGSFLAKSRRYIPVGLTLSIGMGLSVVASVVAWGWANKQDLMQFQRQSDNLATAFQRQIDEYSFIAVSIRAFYGASREITQPNYEEFTQYLLARHSGILTLGWIKPVPIAQRQAYETEIAAGGFPNFYIYEQDATGQVVKAKQRSDYFPITFSPQQKAVGFDLGSHPWGKAVIEKAQVTGDLVATTQLNLPIHSQTPSQTNLAMLLAVYRNDALHNTPETRRQSFQGAIIGVYSVADIINASVQGLNLDQLNFCLYDESAPAKNRFLASYTSHNQRVEMQSGGASCRRHLAYTHSIQVADQRWLLRFWRSPNSSGLGIPPIAGVTLVSGLLLTGTLVAYLLRSLRHTAEIEAEREKSELLLLNILPKPIADRLKQKTETIADSFTEVTVLFADIVGFTQLSERLSPTELVKLLNEIFSAFDQLTETYNLEKIKTIGDAYMVVGGLPAQRCDHAEAIANMALDMQREVARFSAEQGEAFSIRIGINTGPVVAGVIGTKKFIYDLWGDAVNTASRMESHGIPGCIQVTASTYECLRDQYEFKERGTINVKGKG
ncbi:CHASE domain-containing protein, partial [Coleofasciculus sp. LEGE 07081]